MIRTFADRRTQGFFATGKARRFPADVAGRAARKLEYVNLASRIEESKVPPGNRLHALEGDRKGQYSNSINDQWRVCFRFIDGDAWDVAERSRGKKPVATPMPFDWEEAGKFIDSSVA